MNERKDRRAADIRRHLEQLDESEAAALSEMHRSLFEMDGAGLFLCDPRSHAQSHGVWWSEVLNYAKRDGGVTLPWVVNNGRLVPAKDPVTELHKHVNGIIDGMKDDLLGAERMSDKSRADGRVQQIMDDALTAERAAEERRSSWLLGQAKRFADGDKQQKAADAISRFAQEELDREEKAKAAKERRDAWVAKHKKFVESYDRFSESFDRLVQEDLEEQAKERSDRMAAMLRESLEKGESTGMWPPTAPPAPDPAICLATAHWAYIEGIYRAHGLEPEKLEVIKYHYISSFIHGFAHGVKHARIGSVPIPATLESSNE